MLGSSVEEEVPLTGRYLSRELRPCCDPTCPSRARWPCRVVAPVSTSLRRGERHGRLVLVWPVRDKPIGPTSCLSVSAAPTFGRRLAGLDPVRLVDSEQLDRPESNNVGASRFVLFLVSTGWRSVHDPTAIQSTVLDEASSRYGSWTLSGTWTWGSSGYACGIRNLRMDRALGEAPSNDVGNSC